MNLEQKVMADMKTAMLAKDEKGLRSLRAIKAAIILAKTAEGANGEINEADEVKLLQKLISKGRTRWKFTKSKTGRTWRKRSRKRLTSLRNFFPSNLVQKN